MNLKSNILKIFVVIALISILIPVIAAEDVSTSDDVVNVDESNYVVSDDTADSSDNSNTDGGETTDSESGGDGSSEATDSESGDESGGDGSSEATDSESDTDDSENSETDDVESEVSENAVDGIDEYVPSADLQLSVISNTFKAKIGDQVKFAVLLYNDGPDKATNVIVRTGFLSGNVSIISALASKGVYNSTTGIWEVGDLEAGEFVALYLVGQVLSNKDIIFIANAESDTLDPNMTNNFDYWIIDVEEGAAFAGQTMHATGNPILFALLALVSVAGVSLRRKF